MEYLNFCKEELNKVTLFIRMNVVFTLNQPACRWWDDHFVALPFRQREQLIGIISSVRKKLICQ